MPIIDVIVHPSEPKEEKKPTRNTKQVPSSSQILSNKDTMIGQDQNGLPRRSIFHSMSEAMEKEAQRNNILPHEWD